MRISRTNGRADVRDSKIAIASTNKLDIDVTEPCVVLIALEKTRVHVAWFAGATHHFYWSTLRPARVPGSGTRYTCGTRYQYVKYEREYTNTPHYHVILVLFNLTPHLT